VSDRADLNFWDRNGVLAGKVLLIAKKGSLRLLDESESRLVGEERLQLTESCKYEFKVLLSPPNSYLREIPGVLSHSGIPGSEHKSGTLEPGLFTGRLPIVFEKESGEPVAMAAVEVQSAKLDYRTEYRYMIESIADECCDLLLELRAPSQITLRPDIAIRDPKTILHRFAFLKSVLDSKGFQDALRRVIALPHGTLRKMESIVDIRRGFRPDSATGRQIASQWPRVPLKSSHSLSKRMKELRIENPSVPLRVHRYANEQTTNTPENRFVKYSLEIYVEFLTVIQKTLRDSALPQDRALLFELTQIRDNLQGALDDSFLREVDPVRILPLGSPVLQRRGGYRELLLTWLRFNLAANLDWEGGEDVYGAGKKDLAVLYEYWLYFQLLALSRRKFGLQSSSVQNIFIADKDRLSLRLRAGSTLAMEGTFDRHGRSLSVRFSYNRTFGANMNFFTEGAWTRPMRPDFTLSFWPCALSREEAEQQDIMVHIHFDAKYRAETIYDLFGSEDQNLAQERGEQRIGVYRRSDLLKMHSYRDAIRRTEGAYIMYPGDKTKTWQGFHEILPGIGAFCVRPKAGNMADGMTAVDDFLEKVVKHLCNRASRREQLTFHRRRIYSENAPSEMFSPIPELLKPTLKRPVPPQETLVLVAPYRSPDSLTWIQTHQKYPLKLRLGEELDANVIAADFVLVCEEISGNGSTLFRRSSQSPAVESADSLKNLGFPEAFASKDPYLVLEIAPATEFSGWSWNVGQLGLMTDLVYRTFTLERAIKAATSPSSPKQNISDQLVFAYGSNMDPRQMRHRCPDSELAARRAVAIGWKLCFPRYSAKRGGGVGSIIREPRSTVWGVVYSTCGSDLKRLDGFEGVPHSYRRDLVEVEMDTGISMSAWTYVAIPEVPPAEHRPRKDYIDHYIEGAEHYGLPLEYIENLRSIEHAPDADSSSA
jgi:predicted component of viral defense system (DUF524 family)/gamma-glutamylcyclotransferase (GGCT)/AIG2-like uncharacterized protein YtfP